MKKVLLTLAGIFLIGIAATSAQDDPAKLAKSARNALAEFNRDPGNNSKRLDEAKQKVDQALSTPEGQGIFLAWKVKGDVYLTVVESEMARRSFDKNAKMSGDNDALVAYQAYMKAWELATEKYDKKDVVKGIVGVQTHLLNMGIEKYGEKAFEKSFMSFEASVKTHEFLKANKEKSYFDDIKQLELFSLYTAETAALAGKFQESFNWFTKVKDIQKDTTQVDIYRGMYNAKMNLNDEAGADVILKEARKKYPENKELLFDEIIAQQKAGKLGEMTDNLKKAIEKEPNNLQLYLVLGQVYEGLYQVQMKDKNLEKAEEYFAEAAKYYQGGIDKKPDNVEALYALGALYYNKGVEQFRILNEMPEDFSSAGQKKYKAALAEITALYDKALPYFQQAEANDPNDLNTLIALTEVYARKEDELSLEFKKRQEVVRGGGKNSAAHFKKN